jgi:hypothetical protein
MLSRSVIRHFRKQTKEGINFGDIISVEAEEVNAMLIQKLSTLGHRLILTGYSMYNEFQYISESCPEISALFDTWVDVQDLISERSGGSDSGILDVMYAIQITDR